VNPAATPKLQATLLTAGFAVLLGLATGQVELIALAVPLVLLVIRGVSTSSLPTVSIELKVEPDRLSESEETVFTLTLLSNEDVADAEMALALPPAFEVLEGSPRTNIALTAHEPLDVSVRTRAGRWGAHLVGLVAMRSYGPGRMLMSDEVRDLRRVVKVFPRVERLHRYVVPHKAQMSSGEYASRLAGDGIEFANVRRLVSGDSPRRVNWRVSSRSKELYVNTFHVERNSDVVFFIDAFGDVGLEGSSALDLTVRGVASLAQHYLGKRDRVALISFGGALRWLQGQTGRAQIYRIIDFLLDVSVTTSLAWKDIDLVPPRILMPGGLVIAFSPLIDERSIGALGSIHERGTSLVVIDTLDESMVAPSAGAEGRLAYDVWRLRREMFRRELIASGIAVTRMAGDDTLEEVLASIPRRRPIGTRVS
jgi:uncharacterized protein (DUF58 family)